MKKTLFFCFVLIPAVALAGCSLLNREYNYHKLSDGTVEITKYLGKAEALEVSSLLDGKTVTRIGTWAFSDCNSLKSVALPDSVTSIGDCAFLLCKNLSSVTLPAGVRTIGESAFSSCGSLTSVNIPYSVTSIGEWAFGNCAEELTLTVSEDSYAEQYCEENGLKYKYADE